MHFSLHKIMLNSCCFILLLFDLMDAVISIPLTASIPDHSKAGVSRRGTGKVQFAPWCITHFQCNFLPRHHCKTKHKRHCLFLQVVFLLLSLPFSAIGVSTCHYAWVSVSSRRFAPPAQNSASAEDAIMRGWGKNHDSCGFTIPHNQSRELADKYFFLSQHVYG